MIYSSLGQTALSEDLSFSVSTLQFSIVSVLLTAGSREELESEQLNITQTHTPTRTEFSFVCFLCSLELLSCTSMSCHVLKPQCIQHSLEAPSDIHTHIQ